MTEIKNSCWSGKLVIIWTINLSHSRITELVVHWKIYIKTWHIFLSCFYRKQTHHMKTTDHKNIEPRLVETGGWWGINFTMVTTNLKVVHNLITYPVAPFLTLSLKLLPWRSLGFLVSSTSCLFSLLGACNESGTLLHHNLRQ